MSLHLVVHCLSDPFEHYGKALHCQLGSLHAHAPKCKTTIHVCYDDTDAVTLKVVDYWAKKFWRESCWVKLARWTFSRDRLCRRSIGRNAVMLHVAGQAEIVWALDADFVFQEGCLQTLVDIYQRNELPLVCMPDSFYVHKTHELGDEFLASVDLDYDPPELDSNAFKLSRAEIPIGGLQIVHGSLCGEGYLPQSKFQDPVDGSKGFVSFLDDRKFRIHHEKKGRKWERIALPNLYRIRHSRSSMNPLGEKSRMRLPNG